jgi:hypothetical protein
VSSTQLWQRGPRDSRAREPEIKGARCIGRASWKEWTWITVRQEGALAVAENKLQKVWYQTAWLSILPSS